jgi:hypothetical protein
VRQPGSVRRRAICRRSQLTGCSSSDLVARYLPVPAERVRDQRYPSADPQDWRSCQRTLRPKDQHNDVSAASSNVFDNHCSPWVSFNVKAASRASAWKTAMTFPEYRYGRGVRNAGTTRDVAT